MTANAGFSSVGSVKSIARVRDLQLMAEDRTTRVRVRAMIECPIGKISSQ
jgi:hypothetical protein